MARIDYFTPKSYPTAIWLILLSIKRGQNPITLTFILYLFFLKKMEERKATEFWYRVERMRTRVRVLASFYRE